MATARTAALRRRKVHRRRRRTRVYQATGTSAARAACRVVANDRLEAEELASLELASGVDEERHSAQTASSSRSRRPGLPDAVRAQVRERSRAPHRGGCFHAPTGAGLAAALVRRTRPPGSTPCAPRKDSPAGGGSHYVYGDDGVAALQGEAAAESVIAVRRDRRLGRSGPAVEISGWSTSRRSRGALARGL